MEKTSEEAKQRAKNYMSLKGALEPKQETPESMIQEIATHLGKTIPETLEHIEKFSKDLDKLKKEPKQEYSKIKEGLKKSIEGKEHFIQHFKNGGSVEDFKPLETLEEVAKKI